MKKVYFSSLEDAQEKISPGDLLFISGKSHKFRVVLILNEEGRTYNPNIPLIGDYLKFRAFILETKPDWRATVGSKRLVGVFEKDIENYYIGKV